MVHYIYKYISFFYAYWVHSWKLKKIHSIEKRLANSGGNYTAKRIIVYFHALAVLAVPLISISVQTHTPFVRVSAL